jgi:purine-nucleoside phosphorylase
MTPAYKKILEARDFVAGKTSLKPTIGLVLGSGLGAFASQVKADVVIPFADIPNFAKPTVEGHGGKLIIGHVGGVACAVLQGRTHYYEGHSMEQVVLPIRVLGVLGIKKILLTNAAGGLAAGMTPGDLMIIKDHINIMGTNPLIGTNISELGPRFPDMTDLYSKNIREKMISAFKMLNVPYQVGVYCGLSGPTYETPSEVEYVRRMGGDAVGMSTVPEAIAARHMGVEVGGISCITNLAAGMTGLALSHDEVTETGKLVEEKFTSVLKNILPRLV